MEINDSATKIELPRFIFISLHPTRISIPYNLINNWYFYISITFMIVFKMFYEYINSEYYYTEYYI